MITLSHDKCKGTLHDGIDPLNELLTQRMQKETDGFQFKIIRLPLEIR